MVLLSWDRVETSHLFCQATACWQIIAGPGLDHQVKCFRGIGDWTKGFIYVRQVTYHLSFSSSSDRGPETGSADERNWVLFSFENCNLSGLKYTPTLNSYFTWDNAFPSPYSRIESRSRVPPLPLTMERVPTQWETAWHGRRRLH